MYVVKPNEHEYVMNEVLINSISALNAFENVHNMHTMPFLNASAKRLPSLVSPPILELKPLLENLKYVYLGEKETLLVIISSSLDEFQESKLLRVLREHRDVFG